MLKMSALKLIRVATLRYQLSYQYLLTLQEELPVLSIVHTKEFGMEL